MDSVPFSSELQQNTCMHYTHTAEDISLTAQGILPLLRGDEKVLSNSRGQEVETEGSCRPQTPAVRAFWRGALVARRLTPNHKCRLGIQAGGPQALLATSAGCPRSYLETEADVDGLQRSRDEAPVSSSCYLWLILNDACCLATLGCRCCRWGKYLERPAVSVKKRLSAGIHVELSVHSDSHFDF